MKKKKSKEARILNYLLKGKSLTQRQAIHKFDHYRLAVVICRLRDRGYMIITEMITENECTFAEYTLIQS